MKNPYLEKIMFIQHRNFGNDARINCGHATDKHDSGNHIHQYFELELVLDGEIEITVSGKKHTARAGDIAIIPPFKVHSFYTPEHVEMRIMTLPTMFLPESVSFDELSADRDKFVFKASDALWAYLTATGFHTMRTKRSISLPEELPFLHKFRATLHLILAEFLSVTEARPMAASESTLARIMLYVSAHYTEDITLASIGEALGYNPKYVSACFSMVEGISFRDFINSLRIEKAKGLLRSSESTVLAIALECGFKNESTFHRVFLDITGTTPAKYKKEKGGKKAQ